MKKLIFIATILYMITTVANAQVRFGIKGGANVSVLSLKQNHNNIENDKSKRRVGYHFGGMMEYSLTDIFSIQPELMYINNGTSLKAGNMFGMQDARVTLNCVQLPINLKASITVGKTRLFAYGGPYVSFAMYGKVKGTVNGEKVSRELFSKDYDINRWDCGVGVGVGVEYKKFVFSAGNQFGLIDMDKSKNNRMRIRNETLSVGYFF